MSHQSYTLHETMELHELLNFKTVCVTKSKLMQGIVFDQELKSLLEKDVLQSLAAITTLQGLLTKSHPENMEVKQ